MTRFAANGFAEIARRFRRSSLRRTIGRQDAQHKTALSSLGRAAWQAGVDLSAFQALRDELGALANRAGELATTAARLTDERAAVQERRKAEDARFDALLQPVSAAQAEADNALRAWRSFLADKQRAARDLEARVAKLAADLAKPPSAQPAPDAAGPEALQAQHQAAVAQLGAAQAERDKAAADLAAWEARARQVSADAAKVQADRAAALQPIDAELKRLADEAGRAGQETTAVGRDQDDRFAKLGTAMREAGVNEPAIAAQGQAVDAIEAQRRATSADLEASLLLTRSMPRGTMALFWAVFGGLPLAALGAAVMLSQPGLPWRTAEPQGSLSDLRSSVARRTARAPEASDPSSAVEGLASVESDEARKDQVVQDFVRAHGDSSSHARAIEVLRADILRLGSSANRRHVAVLSKIAERSPEPELRAAASEALGMIGPAGDEVGVLVRTLNDPVPAVRAGAARALGQAHDQPEAAALVRLLSTSPTRSGHAGDGAPDVAPDAKALGAPTYAGASFLFFASDLEAGRAAYATTDPFQKVVEFYAGKAGRPALEEETFVRDFLGGTPSDPTGARTGGEALAAWYRDAVQSGRKTSEIEAEMKRRTAELQNLPSLRYADKQVFRDVRFVAFQEETAKGRTRATRWVAVADLPALSKVLVEIHVPAGSVPAK